MASELSISDPLVLLAQAAGLVGPAAATGGAAGGTNDLTRSQRVAAVGEPAPIVFCRRRADGGGVLLQPAATEARFTNNPTTNELTMSLQLVLAAGPIGQLQVRDVRQGPCLVGTLQQTYNQRAGTWTPGNFVTAVASPLTTWDVPVFCGTGGSYRGLTTASFVSSYDDDDDRWGWQINLFVRDGRPVVRLRDGLTGASNNWADLFLLLLRESLRIPDSLIDLPGLAVIAQFLEVNQLFCDVEIRQQSDLGSWLEQTAPKFLTHLSKTDGTVGLRPLLQLTAEGEVYIGPVEHVATFTADDMVAFEREWIPQSQRESIVAAVVWRQQDEGDVGLARTLLVGFADQLGVDAPTETFDLSDVCTTEIHAARFGAYQAARRYHISHTARLELRPGAFNATLQPGQIIRFYLPFSSSVGPGANVDTLYEIARITRPPDGAMVLDLVEHPIDSLGRSVVAVEVARAAAPGYSITQPRDNTSCNVNSPGDDSLVADVGQDLPNLPLDDAFQSPIGDAGDFSPSDWEYNDSINDWVDSNGNTLPEGWQQDGEGAWRPQQSGRPQQGVTEASSGIGDPSGVSAEDLVNNQEPRENLPVGIPAEGPYVGATVTAGTPPCQGGFIEWQRSDLDDASDGWDPIATGEAYEITGNDGGRYIRYTVNCPGDEPGVPYGSSVVFQAGTEDIPNLSPTQSVYVAATYQRGYGDTFAGTSCGQMRAVREVWNFAGTPVATQYQNIGNIGQQVISEGDFPSNTCLGSSFPNSRRRVRVTRNGSNIIDTGGVTIPLGGSTNLRWFLSTTPPSSYP